MWTNFIQLFCLSSPFGFQNWRNALTQGAIFNRIVFIFRSHSQVNCFVCISFVYLGFLRENSTPARKGYAQWAIYIYFTRVLRVSMQRKINICVKYLRAVSTTWFLNTHYLFALFAAYISNINNNPWQFNCTATEWMGFIWILLNRYLSAPSSSSSTHFMYAFYRFQHLEYATDWSERTTNKPTKILQTHFNFDVNFENWNIAPHHTPCAMSQIYIFAYVHRNYQNARVPFGSGKLQNDTIELTPSYICTECTAHTTTVRHSHLYAELKTLCVIKMDCM